MQHLVSVTLAIHARERSTLTAGLCFGVFLQCRQLGNLPENGSQVPKWTNVLYNYNMGSTPLCDSDPGPWNRHFSALPAMGTYVP